MPNLRKKTSQSALTIRRAQVAFTLIELLIVVAIIAILAAIAVPNFLEAQTRSKVARVKNDFRTVAIGIEAYAADNNKYPRSRAPGYMIRSLHWRGSHLTTPVAYLTSLPERDIFKPENRAQFNPEGLYQYFFYDDSGAALDPTANTWTSIVGYPNRNAWGLVSWGPDGLQSQGEHLEYAPNFSGTIPFGSYGGVNGPVLYDPTNGTRSDGDLVRFGGESRSIYGQTP